MAGRKKQSTEAAVREIRRRTRRKFAPEEKIRIVLEGLISGGNDGVGENASGHRQRGTYGNVQIHSRRGGRDETPPIAAYHPEIANPRDTLPTDISCTEALMSVPQILFANLTTAAAMLNAFFLHTCHHLDYPELSFDIADGLMRPVQLPWAAGGGEG